MAKSRWTEEEINEGKIFAVLAYLSFLCIIPLIFKKENPFVLKHGKQGLIIFVAEVAVFVLQILLGTWLLKLGMFIFGVASFVGIVAVLHGQDVAIPYVSKIAETITL